MIKPRGISIPIAFEYNFRGRQYDEIEVYFSFYPIERNQIDTIEPGKILSKKKFSYFLNKNSAGSFDYLIPYQITPRGNYEAPWGLKFAIGCLDGNPTTATMLNRIGLLACKSNNLNLFLKIFSPDFYLCARENRLFIRIKINERYDEFPSQDYSPNCWRGFAHSSILMQGISTPLDYEKIDWKEVCKAMKEMQLEALRAAIRQRDPEN